MTRPRLQDVSRGIVRSFLGAEVGMCVGFRSILEATVQLQDDQRWGYLGGDGCLIL
jgi:hypothetical protein